MGQYFRGAILKKNHKLAKNPVLVSFRPSKFGNGAKLMEHSYVGNEYINAYMEMISDSDGAYFGYPFAWVGDYADDMFGKNYYDDAKNIEDMSLKTYQSQICNNKKYKYLVNLTKKEYVVIPEDIEDTLVLHPLSLLTAIGNGRGCGDYHGIDENNIGIWAFNRIGATNNEEEIKGMKERKLNFQISFKVI